METWDSFLNFPSEPDLLPPLGIETDRIKSKSFADFIPACDAKTRRSEVRSPVKKKRRTGRSRKPKKPRTGYNYFHLHERDTMMRDLLAQGSRLDKEALNAEVNRRIAQKWKTMGVREKQVHLEKSEADKIRYEKELAEYHKSSSGSGDCDELPSRCLPGTLDDLKTLAEKLGIKRARVGWAICCPPSGTKTDIRRAVLNHMKSQPDSHTALPIMPSGCNFRLALPDPERTTSPMLTTRSLSPTLGQPVASTDANRPVSGKPMVPIAEKKNLTDNLMSMRTLGSQTWLLDLARRHNLLSEKSMPFLKDAMDAIEKEMSLTMTRMSKRVLSIVANNANISPETNIHKLLKEFNKRQQDFKVSPELVSMVNAISMNDISRPQNLVRLTTGAVQGFFMLNKPLCDLLISEAKRCAKYCELKFGQISVEALGLQEAMTKLAIESILPALDLDCTVEYEVDGSIIYDGDKPLFEDFTLTADPADDWKITGSERSLPNHMDDSVITINVCLGDNFTGGSILFEEVVEIEHQVCRGIVHPGSMRHRITPCKGQRFNLILFLNKKTRNANVHDGTSIA